MSIARVRLSHLGLSVFDLDKMVDFYTRVMGMIVSDSDALPGGGGRIAFLTSNPEDHHQLALVEGRTPEAIPTDPPLGGSMGSQLFQMSFKLPDLATLKMMKRRIADEGMTGFVPINHGNAWALYVRDPEGNALELYVDTPWYIAQPCGFRLDLDASDEEIFAKTEAHCRKQPEFRLRTDWLAEQTARITAAQAALT